MLQAIIKYAVSALLVVVISEAGKRSALVGAIVASLPVVSILALIWLYAETKNAGQVARLSYGVFWLVLPSLLLFILLPVLLRHGMAFAAALGLSIAATACAYGLMVWGLGRFGVTI